MPLTLNSGNGGASERGCLSFFGKNAVANLLKTQVLVEQVQEGDRDALQELCSRYYSRILAAVRLRLGSALRRKLESCDVVQEVLIDALRQVHTFEFKTEGAFMHYLNRVVANKIRDQADHWNAQKRDIVKEVPLENPSSSASGNPLNTMADHAIPTPSKIVGLSEDLALLEEAMDRLAKDSEEDRDLIFAVKLEGKTYAEIAEEKGRSTDAVRMAVKRATLRLTRIFTDLTGSR
jgi:RNA polymerase sigma-70 factor (subfamily 1)